MTIRPSGPREQGKPAGTIACFGEALWDVLPRGIFLGGAPLNVACHLARFGVCAVPISAVGNDFLGDEVLRRLSAWKLDDRFVSRSRHLPTGTVRATLNDVGVARYEIADGVAWDRISPPNRRRKMPAPDAIVFGSLALRHSGNRQTLGKLLAAWPGTLRVLDLNLRTPFDRGAGVAFALRQAEFVKLNDDELARLGGAVPRTQREIEAAARRFATRHGVRAVCVTAGARGAGLLWAGDWFWEKARPVVVRDTIGAGDAFLAAFLVAHLTRRETPAEMLASACRLGEFVAAQDGATPPYRINARGRPLAAAT